jgi:MFS family permease
MVLLAGAASFFVGNAYSSQMPGFAADLDHGDPGVAYSMLLAADAAGGLLGGLILEGGGLLPPRPRTAIVLALLWSAALVVFALAPFYWLAVGFLCLAGFLELSFNAMAQSLVQLNGPRKPDRHSLVAVAIGPGRDGGGGRPAIAVTADCGGLSAPSAGSRNPSSGAPIGARLPHV